MRGVTSLQVGGLAVSVDGNVDYWRVSMATVMMMMMMYLRRRRRRIGIIYDLRFEVRCCCDWIGSVKLVVMETQGQGDFSNPQVTTEITFQLFQWKLKPVSRS